MVVEERRAYTKVTLDLSTARTDEPYEMVGDFIIVQKLTGECEVKLNEKTNDPVDLTVFSTIKSPFDRFFITNTAQAGKECILMVGRAAAFETQELPTGLKVWDGTAWQKGKGDSDGRLFIYHGKRDAVDYKVFDAVTLPGTGTLTHTGLDVSDYRKVTIMVSTTQNCTVYVQVSDDNTNFYDPKTVADADITHNCNNEKICFDVPVYAHYLRVVVYNNTATDAIVTGIVSCQV